MLLVATISLLSSIIGSMISLAIWFHYDLEGFWEHKRHARMMRRGRQADKQPNPPPPPPEGAGQIGLPAPIKVKLSWVEQALFDDGISEDRQ